MGLIIVGAGGFGREVLCWARDAGMTVRGFTDSGAGEPRDDSAPVLGDLSTVHFDPHDRFVIAVGDTVVRRRLAAQVWARGGRLATVIHPTAYVAATATIGDGAVICPFAMVGVWARLDANVVVNTYASVAHDAELGSHVILSPYATVNGNVRLGEGVFLGTSAVVTPGLDVGAWSKIGAGTVVTRRVPEGTLAIGTPPKTRVMFTPPAD